MDVLRGTENQTKRRGDSSWRNLVKQVSYIKGTRNLANIGASSTAGATKSSEMQTSLSNVLIANSARVT